VCVWRKRALNETDPKQRFQSRCRDPVSGNSHRDDDGPHIAFFGVGRQRVFFSVGLKEGTTAVRWADFGGMAASAAKRRLYGNEDLFRDCEQKCMRLLHIGAEVFARVFQGIRTYVKESLEANRVRFRRVLQKWGRFDRHLSLRLTCPVRESA